MNKNNLPSYNLCAVAKEFFPFIFFPLKKIVTGEEGGGPVMVVVVVLFCFFIHAGLHFLLMQLSERKTPPQPCIRKWSLEAQSIGY